MTAGVGDIASCGTCPQLSSHTQHDLSHWTWLYKQRAWRTVNWSRYAQPLVGKLCARQFAPRQSSRGSNRLWYRHETFRPHPKAFARDLLGLPQDKKLILFGAANSTEDPERLSVFAACAWTLRRKLTRCQH